MPLPMRQGVFGMARRTGVSSPNSPSRYPVLTPAAIDTTRGLFPPCPRLSTALAMSFGLTQRITRSAPSAAVALAVVQATESSRETFSALAFVRAVARTCSGFTLRDSRSPETMVRPMVPDPMTAIRLSASMKAPPEVRLVHSNHRNRGAEGQVCSDTNNRPNGGGR